METQPLKKPRGQSVDDAQIRIQDMLDLLPRGCLGEFDFISGLLYVHCKNAEYKALVAKRSKAQGRWNAELSQRERLIVETSMHEYFHYLQVLSCGYLFETVAALSDALTGTLNRFKQDGSDDARLAGFGRIARNILRSLRHRDEGSSLSPIDIIEGAAYYFQARSLEQVSDHDGMLKAVALPGLPEEYARAYEYASARLERDTFDKFLSLAAYALLFAEPVAVFEAFVNRAATGSISGEFLKSLMARYPYVGTAVEVWALRNKDVFTWYNRPLSKLAKAKGMPPAFFDDWEEGLERRLLAPPLVFQDSYRGDLGIQAMFAVMAHRSALQFTLSYTGTAAQRQSGLQPERIAAARSRISPPHTDARARPQGSKRKSRQGA